MTDALKSREEQSLPSFSVVIPARDEEKNIGSLLQLIINEGIPCEIIVADSESDPEDRTGEIVRAFAAQYPDFSIRCIKAPRGVSWARNRGAEEAKGEYVFFSDADTRFHADFLKKSLEEMVTRQLDAAGFNFVPNTDKVIDHIILGVHGLVQDVMSKTSRPACTGAMLLAKREFHQKIGGFPTDTIAFEDVEWSLKAAKEGGRFGILSEKPIFDMTRFEGRRPEFIIKHLRNGVHLALTGKAHATMSDEYKHDRTGHRYK